MRISKMTEKECREFNVPWFTSISELEEFIDSLDILNHDYGTAAYAMTLAATASFQYIAKKFGCTGFQASCADLDIIRRTRLLKGPFMIIDGEKGLYPQYDLRERLEEFLADDYTKNWLREEAIKNLQENPNAHPNVINHWKMLASTVVKGEKDANK